MRRYSIAKECMEKVVQRKRVCNFGMVRCECTDAMECPAKRAFDAVSKERDALLVWKAEAKRMFDAMGCVAGEVKR